MLVLLPRPVRTGSDGDDEATDHSSITDDLIIDTGRYVSVCWHEMIDKTGYSSSNTWVGSGRSYVRTSTSVQTSNSVVCTVDSCRTIH